MCHWEWLHRRGQSLQSAVAVYLLVRQQQRVHGSAHPPCDSTALRSASLLCRQRSPSLPPAHNSSPLCTRKEQSHLSLSFMSSLTLCQLVCVLRMRLAAPAAAVDRDSRGTVTAAARRGCPSAVHHLLLHSPLPWEHNAHSSALSLSVPSCSFSHLSEFISGIRHPLFSSSFSVAVMGRTTT